VVAIEKLIHAVFDREEIDVHATTSILRAKNFGSLKTTLAALATMDSEDAHAGQTREVRFLLDIGRSIRLTLSATARKLAGHQKCSGHCLLKVEMFDDAAELGGKNGVHSNKSVGVL
jgi:hypothetical protein